MKKSFVTRYSITDVKQEDIDCLLNIISEFYGEAVFHYQKGLLKIWFEKQEWLEAFKKAVEGEPKS